MKVSSASSWATFFQRRPANLSEKMRLQCVMLFVIPIVWAMFQCPVMADPPPGPYCGLFAVHAALRLFDKPVDFRDLLKPDYVDATEGSSQANISSAAQNNGLFTAVVDRLCVADLDACSCPMVLHVKPNVAAPSFTHWILFLGVEGANVKVLDEDKPLQRISIAELAERWDGIAVLVSKTPISGQWIVFLRALRLAVRILFLAICILVTKLGLRRWQSFGTRTGAVENSNGTALK